MKTKNTPEQKKLPAIANKQQEKPLFSKPTIYAGATALCCCALIIATKAFTYALKN